MYTSLGSAALKSGRRLACGVVLGPDAEWAPRLEPFLAHKRPEWRRHIGEALRRPLDALETRFYVGCLGDPQGELISCVMVASARGVGLLGYVFTAPEHRQQGAYSALMARQMEDCARSGHTILTLTTAFESPAYRIYERFGFRSIDGTSGRMKWLATPGAERDWFQPGPARLAPLAWDDWSTLNLTALRVPQPDEPDLPRSWVFRLLDYGTAEGTFAQVLDDWAPIPRLRATHAATLRTASGAVAGWVVLRPDELTAESTQLLDLYVHPAFLADGEKLMAGVPWPADKGVTAYTTWPDGYRGSLLRDWGFRQEATLPGWIPHRGTRKDLYAFARR